MTASIAGMVVALLNALLPLIGNLASGQVANIINLLTEIIPVVVKEAEDLVQPIQNIIAAIKSSNGQVTPEQLAALDALNAQIDAEFDAAAKAAGLE